MAALSREWRLRAPHSDHAGLSLLLWTPDQQTTNIIMWGRCVVSVGCSILLRVIGHQAAATTPSSLIPESSLDYQELARQIVLLLAHIWWAILGKEAAS